MMMGRVNVVAVKVCGLDRILRMPLVSWETTVPHALDKWLLGAAYLIIIPAIALAVQPVVLLQHKIFLFRGVLINK